MTELKKDHWFKFYYHRILVSCAGWKDDEFGAFIKLLIHQFDKGFVPKNEKELKRIITTYKKNWTLLSAKFKEVEPGVLKNKVMEVVRQEYEKKKEKGKETGSLGGRPKKENQKVSNLEPKGFENERDNISLSVSDSKGETVFYKIEHCLTVAMNDERWVNANKATEKELKEFNSVLERRGIYSKNPADYKEHFGNWKAGGKKEIPAEKIPTITYQKL